MTHIESQAASASITGWPANPAAFPSALSTQGRTLVDANGFTMPQLKGFNMLPNNQVLSKYTDIYAKGGRVIRTRLHWDDLQTGPPATPTDYSVLSSTFIATIDAHVANCYAAGLYTTINFFTSPQSVHTPTWAQVNASMGAPATPSPAHANTGGTVAAGTYTVAVTYMSASGETVASATATVTTTGTTSTITVPSPVTATGATGWFAYVSQAGGSTLYRQQQSGAATAIGTGLTLTSPPSTTTGISPRPTGLPVCSMSNYLAFGQLATQYLAMRYGDLADPLSAGQETNGKCVIGFGLNEITPDDHTVNSWVTTLMGQQATMMDWFRAYAPSWLALISPGFGAYAIYANASGSGHSDQVFTSAAADPFAGRGNWVLDFHDYLMASTDGTDTRDTMGATINSKKIVTNDTTNAGGENYTTYPPATGGVTLTRAQCQARQAAYRAPAAAFTAAGYANVPLFIGEWGWAPVNGGVTFSGGSAYIADKLAGWAADSAPAVIMQWDWQTNQVSDPYAAQPGVGATGADADGWQTVTNLFFA